MALANNGSTADDHAVRKLERAARRDECLGAPRSHGRPGVDGHRRKPADGKLFPVDIQHHRNRCQFDPPGAGRESHLGRHGHDRALYWVPSLGLGETRASTGSSGNELSFNADVEYSLPIASPLPIAPVGPPSPAAKCVVPKLKGKKLKAVRKKLKKADCTLGKVKGAKTKTAKVKKQNPKPGKVLPPNAKVNVTLFG